MSALLAAPAPRGHGIPRARLALLGLGGIALLAGLTGALVLLGVGMPSSVARLAAVHGELMTLGFLGTVVALERAVALGRPWGYLSPALSGAGALALIAGITPVGGAGILGGAVMLLAIYAAFARHDRSLQLGVQAVAAGAWVGGAVLLLAGVPVSTAYPWLAAFLVMTVTGERLDLARLGGLATPARRQLIVALWLLVLAVTATLVEPEAGIRAAGVAMLAIAAWLARHDLARRTVRLGGVTRYIAVCLLAGYGWLAVAGAAWALTGTAMGAAYDIRLHALFLGFIISMVFGHAPVIIPSVLRVPMPYSRASVMVLALLHIGLIVRIVGGDILGVPGGLLTGGVLNVLALLAFVAVSMASAVLELRRRSAIGARRVASARPT